MSTTVDDRPLGQTCAIALDGDQLAGYVSGRLDEAEAEAFEKHYFACEECWALVRAAAAAQGSFARESPPRMVPAGRGVRSRRAFLIPAAGLAAAIAGVALFGVWQRDPGEPTGDVFRGVEETMALEAVVDGLTLRTRWAPIAAAAGYELRLYDSGGRLLRASDVDALTVAVDIDVLELGGVPAVASMDIVALDALGQVLLRSERVTLQR